MPPKATIILEVDDRGTVKFRNVGKEVEKLSKDTTRSFKSVTDQYDTFQKSVMGLGGAMVFQQAVTGVINLAKLGAEAKNVTAAFAGIKGSVDLLEQLRKSSKGAVPDLELMRSSLVGIDLGATNQQLKTFMDYARMESVRKGKDTLTTYNEILSGVLRGSTELLDNFGISITQLNLKVDELANKSGMAAGKLSELERRQLAVKAATELMSERLQKAGELPMTDAEKINSLSAAWDNLSVSIGKLASSPIASFFSDLADDVNALNVNVQAFSMASFNEKIKLVGSDIAQRLLDDFGDAAASFYGLFGKKITVFDELNKGLLDYISNLQNAIVEQKKIGSGKNENKETIYALKMPDVTVTAKREPKKSGSAATSAEQKKTKSEYVYSPGLGFSEIETGQDIAVGKMMSTGYQTTASSLSGSRRDKTKAAGLVEELDQVNQKFEETFTMADQLALSTSQAIGQSFMNAFSGIGSAADGMWNMLFNNGRSVAQQIAISFLSSMTQAFVSIAAKFAAMQIMNFVLPGSGTSMGMGSMFMASGGPVSAGRPYIVGERGPELFVPKYSGSIVPNNQISFAGDNITVNASSQENLVKAITEKRTIQREEIIKLIKDLNAKDRFPK
jgi:hypothetical protein